MFAVQVLAATCLEIEDDEIARTGGDIEAMVQRRVRPRGT